MFLASRRRANLVRVERAGGESLEYMFFCLFGWTDRPAIPLVPPSLLVHTVWLIRIESWSISPTQLSEFYQYRLQFEGVEVKKSLGRRETWTEL